ncbi:COesterase domain containing protein, partial [Asbolus verrucosus]
FTGQVVINSSSECQVSEPFVTLSNGQIRGRVAKTIQNTTYYAFEKIPYASPPIGKLRFQPPIPPQNWGVVLDTSHLDAICYQLSYNKGSETEDCLFINVFTPSLPNGESNPSLAVMFFIHGGGFVDESSLMAKPDLFIENGVILVAINYRLGP